MKSYIITVIGAALLSALAEIISPEKWRGYVKIITGLVVISSIIAPAAGLVHSGASTKASQASAKHVTRRTKS